MKHPVWVVTRYM